MYASFFGLKREPFSIAPDPRYLFMSERHREALAHLLYGVNGGGGFVLLSGEIGAGKTTVCRCFLEQIPPHCNVAYIFNPKLTAVELLRSVCEEFSVPLAPPVAGERATVKDYLDPLNVFLLQTHAVGQNSVLIIDEAQMLSAEVLEQLRLLTNLETNDRKLLQIVLIGQPELRGMLARPELEQLAQRVIARYHLGALTEEECLQYIRHRLGVAGLSGTLPFDAKALHRIYRVSRGVPRRINLLCDRALLGAYALGRPQVDREIVDTAAGEVFFTEGASAARSSPTRPAWTIPAVVGTVAAVAAIVSAVLLFGTGGVRKNAPALASAVPDPAVASTRAAAAANALGRATADADADAAASATSGTSGAAPAASQPRTSEAQRGPESIGSTRIFQNAADLLALFGSAAQVENDAWRQLALDWKLSLTDADACLAAQRSQVHCFRSAGSTLAMIRQLDRPGLLTLHLEAETPVYAVLTGLTEKAATLRIGTVTQTVSLLSLASLWRGEFATLWRAPPGYTGKTVDAGTGVTAAWVTTRLAALPGAASGAAATATDLKSWRARVAAFQVSQGLNPDGLAGPATLMQLMRAAGSDEPHLSTGSAAR